MIVNAGIIKSALLVLSLEMNDLTYEYVRQLASEKKPNDHNELKY